MTEEYIRKADAVDALKALEEPAPTARHLSAIFDCEDAIKSIEPADVVPVVHGKWNKLSYDGFNCNKCGSTFVIMQGKENMHFCPNCGTKMDGGAHG